MHNQIACIKPVLLVFTEKMKNNYSGIWLLLALALSAVVSVAMADDITIGGWTVRKAPVADVLFPSEKSSEEEGIQVFIPDTVPPIEKVTVDSVAKSILLFGDSMTFNLALQLAKYAKQNGHTFHAVNWDSSNTKIWSDTDTLAHYMKLYKADYIFISLGSNEVYFKNPETRLPYIRKILTTIGNVPYVWIGPPNWNEDTKINDILESTCAPGSFFRSQGMKFKRKADKIHPTRASSALWLDSIMRWLPSSRHPILADPPSDSIGQVKTNIIFLKALNK